MLAAYPSFGPIWLSRELATLVSPLFDDFLNFARSPSAGGTMM
jgi:hypothetical protein